MLPSVSSSTRGLTLVLTFFVIAAAFPGRSLAQSQGCPSTGPRKRPKGAHVYFKWNSDLTTKQQIQIADAMSVLSKPVNQA
jgi:hypothetical protein